MDLSKKRLRDLPIDLPSKLDDFDCSFNKLTSLKNSPEIIDGFFSCNDNYLSNLEGSPNYVGKYMDCCHNELTSLLGAPKYIGDKLGVENNKHLNDVSDIWDCIIVNGIIISYVTNLAILPLIKFKVAWLNSKWLPETRLTDLFTKNYGSSKKNILDFQYDLIENGYADNAKWKPTY